MKSRLKHLDFERFSFRMGGTIAIALEFENRTIVNPTFKKSGFQMFPVVRFQIPTVNRKIDF